MLTIHPYLNFSGNTLEAFNFYKKVFGGEFSLVLRFRDTSEAGRVPEEHLDKLMHIALPVGQSVLMATDALPEMGHHLQPGNNFHISIMPDNKREAERIFNELSEDGKISVQFQKESWGEYFGMFTDKFGMNWMVNCKAED
ncbi:VOC family protein [Desertivirga arenae]|uniref:VOC family protein n=1 Tax=Desertivirga arenae TaxID=2810309 RepID=UPI001A960403|nr:VOC family protein [Pedobacter sp. SYSU D00823]